jgi:UDP-GlcNAc:undecaprenyl-phosphate GlcNAc-1-phosphate transferase
MGDCGALFLGFVMGAIALLSEYDRSRNLGTVLLTPVLILLIPIFDTCMVTVTRKLSGRPISQGGRDHTSHRLVALGVSERRAVLLLYALAVAAGLLALIVRGCELKRCSFSQSLRWRSCSSDYICQRRIFTKKENSRWGTLC